MLLHRRQRHTALTLWHLLSFDAPTVATVWTAFIARCAGFSLPWPDLMASFAGVWMIYAADRLLDARVIDANDSSSCSELEDRHRFHHRYRNFFMAGMVVAATALALLLPHLHTDALVLYAMLAILLSVWLLMIHMAPSAGRRRLPKELAVGIFFAAAVFIPTVARFPAIKLQMLPVAGLLAAACTLNCLYLYAWEHPNERTRIRAHWTTLIALHRLTSLSVSVGVLALVYAGLTLFRFRHASMPALACAGPALACAGSVALLLWLNHRRGQISKLKMRALADLVLLTPLLVWWTR